MSHAIDKITAVIFDLDGVIVDTAKYHYQAWNRLAQTMGFSISESQNDLLKGVSRMESLDLILRLGNVDKTPEERQELAVLKNEWYLDLISNLSDSDLLPGVVDLLDDLVANNIKIALGSASRNSVTILTGLHLIDRFDAIIDGTKTTKSKPDPQVFNMGAEAIGEAPQNCIVLEDSIKGLQAALSGGFKTLGVGSEEGLQIADRVTTDLSGMTYAGLCQPYTAS
jgi:beta-phosphoglucomutase